MLIGHLHSFKGIWDPDGSKRQCWGYIFFHLDEDPWPCFMSRAERQNTLRTTTMGQTYSTGVVSTVELWAHLILCLILTIPTFHISGKHSCPHWLWNLQDWQTFWNTAVCVDRITPRSLVSMCHTNFKWSFSRRKQRHSPWIMNYSAAELTSKLCYCATA